MRLALHSRKALLLWEEVSSRTSSPMAHRMFATNDQGGDAVQGKPDDPNTIAPKGSQDAGPSNAASGQQSAPSDKEVEEEGKKQGLKEDDIGSANVEKNADKNAAADDPASDTAAKFKNVSNTERDAASTA